MRRGLPMTGRDLIIYILQNNLEDEPVFEDGKLLGFVTAGEVAEEMDVGVATVYVWIHQKRLDGVFIGGKIYIPANYVLKPEY
jgi:excisionase family DNA binding protein